MTRSRFSLLGVLMAAVGLMALFASSAQAEAGARWLVLKAGAAGLYSDAEIEANKERFEGTIENNNAALLSKLLGVKVAIKCTAGELVDALLAANASVKEGAKVKFTGCTMRSGGTDGLLEPAEGCVPHSNGSPNGTVETRPGHALARLHSLGEVKDDIVLILPDNAQEEFVNLEMGEECAFGENIAVFGLFAVQDCQGLALVHATSHLITEFAPLTKLWLITHNAEHLETKIDGSANITLASGKSFAETLK